MSLHELLQRTYLGNPVQAWLLALAAFLITFTVLPLLRSLVMSQRKRIQSLEPPLGVELVLGLIARTSRVFLWVVALYVAERFLDLTPRVERISTVIIVVVFWLQVGLWGAAAANFALDRQRLRAAAAGDQSYQGSLGILGFIAKVVIFAVVTLLALDNLGINITALVAGLGIGGIAIALAVQTILGDLLASLSITLDKPFVTGDTLRLDDIEGVVERIGVKSTRLRSVSGEQIVISNADLLKSRVRNLGRMPEQRALFTLGVTYETPRALLEQVPKIVETAITAVRGTRFVHCAFRRFGDFALHFEVCYYVPLADGPGYLKVIDAVNFRIHAAFEQHGVQFAYPTQTVLVRQSVNPVSAAAAT